MSAKARVLAALQDGPKTTSFLCQPECGGVRFGARLAELRHDDGHTITEERLRAGSSLYTLVGSSSGASDVRTPASPSGHAARSSGRTELLLDYVHRRPDGSARYIRRTGCPPERIASLMTVDDALAQLTLEAA